jgi:hypothetical protein
MDCERIREQLGAYLDDEVSQDTRREVETHLSACPVCTGELDSLGRVAEALAPQGAVAVPDRLWNAIEQRLDDHTHQEVRSAPRAVKLRFFRRPVTAAASVLFAVGIGLLAISLLDNCTQTARASTVDFSVLLDALPLDAHKALQKFLALYGAREIQPDTVHERAPDLNFEVPASLPGGFRREAVYALRFGDAPGIAAEYYRDDGEFLAALFHPTVQREDFGTHKDRECVIGKHRGHTVEVGQWRLVHLTDPTTCHCVLSRLDLEHEVPAVMAAVAPRSVPLDNRGHGGAGHDHPPGEAP